MSHEMPSVSSPWIQRGLRAVLRFVRSMIAEWIIYALVVQSMTAIATFYFLLPISLVEQALHGHGYLADYFLIFAPLNLGFRLSTFTFPHRVLIVALWTLTARPSLALAGWVVRKRIPAYTVCIEDYPPIRWWFEFFCYFANRNHYIIPDPKYYFYQVLYLSGIISKKGSLRLGTVSPEEHKQLRIFIHKFYAVTNQYYNGQSDGYSGPWMPPFPLKYGELAHYLCAHEVLSQVPVQPTNTGEGVGEREGMEKNIFPWASEGLFSDFYLFLFMYGMSLAYWILRIVGEAWAAWGPCFGIPSSFEEWYNIYVLPST